MEHNSDGISPVELKFDGVTVGVANPLPVTATITLPSTAANNETIYGTAVIGNIVHNDDFEGGITGWVSQAAGSTLSSSSAFFKFGTKSLKVVTDGTGAGQGVNYQGLVWRIGDTFNCTAWIRGTAGDVVALILFDAGGTTVIRTYTFLQTGVFERFNMIATTSSDATNGFFIVSTSGSEAVTWYIDTVSVSPADTRSLKLEDTGHNSGDIGSFQLGVRNDNNASMTSNDGDYSPINVDKAGRAQVRDDFDSMEVQKITLVASTDTTVTFAEEVGLVKISNTDLTNVVYIKDGAITTDTPSDAQQIGISPLASLPTVDWFPFKTTTLHLRSAGASVVYVTGFYRNNS